MPDYLDLFQSEKPQEGVTLTREDRLRAEVRKARKARDKAKALARSRRNAAAAERQLRARRRRNHFGRP